VEISGQRSFIKAVWTKISGSFSILFCYRATCVHNNNYLWEKDIGGKLKKNKELSSSLNSVSPSLHAYFLIVATLLKTLKMLKFGNYHFNFCFYLQPADSQLVIIGRFFWKDLLYLSKMKSFKSYLPRIQFLFSFDSPNTAELVRIHILLSLILTAHSNTSNAAGFRWSIFLLPLKYI
jgi:hypothetical protein